MELTPKRNYIGAFSGIGAAISALETFRFVTFLYVCVCVVVTFSLGGGGGGGVRVEGIGFRRSRQVLLSSHGLSTLQLKLKP